MIYFSNPAFYDNQALMENQPCFSGKITNAKGTQVSSETGTVSVTLDGTSTWTLTANTYITEFTGNAEKMLSVTGTPFTSTAPPWKE